jgi:hypothetical protein
MSFVYAKKIANSIAVFADTKITFDPTGTKILWSEETHELIRQFGLVKNIIFSKNFCVSFAGNNIVYINELLSQINQITLSQLLSIAFNIHCRDIENGMDFIICFANNSQQSIYEIKDGKCNEVNFAWIGSYDAFNYFQSTHLGKTQTIAMTNNPLGVEISFGTASQSAFDLEYDKLFNAFHKTLADCGDATVGGFVVPIIYDTKQNEFKYKGYAKSYAKLEMKNGMASLPMYQGADKGVFSVLFYTSRTIVGLYIPQGHLGIVYNHHRTSDIDYDNLGTSKLLIPQTVKMNQLDFYIQVEAQGMTAPGFLGCEPDNIDEIFKRIDTYKDHPTMALLYINKIIEIIKTQHRDTERLDFFLAIKQNIEAGICSSEK